MLKKKMIEDDTAYIPEGKNYIVKAAEIAGSGKEEKGKKKAADLGQVLL